MASIGHDPGGYRRILFVAADGSRKTIRLGKASRKHAEQFKIKLEELIAAHATGSSLSADVLKWLADMPGRVHGRLVAAGLVRPKDRTATTLKSFMDDYFASLAVKSATATSYGHTRRCLLSYFGENKPLRDIQPADADKWRQWLRTANIRDNDRNTISEATIARRVVVARQIFGRAVTWKLVGDNPFADVKTGSQTNKARMFFVTRDVAQKVLDACPDAQWRLLFALSRFGGLRCPSEHLALKWGDVDWHRSRIRITSPKTEHHEGGDCRFIPIFPELRPYLMQVFEEAEPGAEHVITRYRSAGVNLRTQPLRIIRRAGLQPWPKLFHNLRSTRQTELAERYPIHVVCQWLGNSQAVAQEHYLQVTDAHFAAAIEPEQKVYAAQNPAQLIHESSLTNQERGKAAQIPAQSGAELSGIEQNPEQIPAQKNPDLPGDSEPCRLVQDSSLGAVGFEYPSKMPEKAGVVKETGTNSGTPDDDLQKVIQAWPMLPRTVRRQIVGLCADKGR